VAKLCNNLLLGITMAGVSEAFNLGESVPDFAGKGNFNYSL